MHDRGVEVQYPVCVPVRYDPVIDATDIEGERERERVVGGLGFPKFLY